MFQKKSKNDCDFSFKINVLYFCLGTLFEWQELEVTGLLIKRNLQ
ncbi:hypothetical protein [Pasteurella canis]|uniref:Uncharacterized protein n=1 Tax=Pasteurella canis TaxID=753 RepID=A0ABQ4VNL8_9PAST|nr:hypothetical protein [Pasteurella canis]GJH43237.1 hypothetical protein PA42_14110 [Pasteurella canis]GJJ79436.1 hypothetical protein PcPA57_01560 [Pasteurella canis]